LSIERLVFIDETWAATNMTPRYGRCPRGRRLVAAVPHGHWKITTFIGALRTTGLTAPAVIDGAVNGDIFLAYVHQVLVPTLKPGDIVVMDNLSSHKVAGVREAIEAAAEHSCATCRPTRPISIPSSNSSPSSRRFCARLRLVASKRSGPQSATSSSNSTQANAQTTSTTPGMYGQIESALIAAGPPLPHFYASLSAG